jgi:hydroxymethylglutaryl-CoA reductase
MNTPGFSGFYRMTVDQRLAALVEQGFISPKNAQSLQNGRPLLDVAGANRMIENVIGVFGLPLGIATNFNVNGHDYLVPMAVEEPSIVAGVSNAARLVKASGGFVARADDSLLIGQVQVVNIPNVAAAMTALRAAGNDLVERANALHPNMLARGGGARSIELHRHTLPNGDEMLIVHLLVDTQDAMGANLVNTMCEGIAADIEKISGGRVHLRILSNLADRSLVTAKASIPVADLRSGDFSGEEVRDGIILANDFALVDPYRATTHNKGIMNGIDAVAIATGNDWRALEAAAHAHAAADGKYKALTKWRKGAGGELEGELTLPVKVGIVGGTLGSNPGVNLCLGILGVQSAGELARLIGAAGLAQNLAALRALATDGIQRGHMRLHARSVADAAGAPEHLFNKVVDRLVGGGDIKVEKAREILERMQAAGTRDLAHCQGRASAKVILLGEHAAVYGKPVLAVPIEDAVAVHVEETGSNVEFTAPDWDLELRFSAQDDTLDGAAAVIALIMQRLGLPSGGFRIELFSRIPKAMGLGASASLAVAVIRAFDTLLDLQLSNEEVNDLAFACEELSHGTPSGIDNTVATYGQPLLYRKGPPAEVETIKVPRAVPLVIACSGVPGYTHEQVAGVRRRFEENTDSYTAIFAEIGRLSQAGATALASAGYQQLGAMMNVCHGLLNALEVSTPELEKMVCIAREAGAAGAKLTGSGGGGSIVAICPGKAQEVTAALQAAGYKTVLTHVE